MPHPSRPCSTGKDIGFSIGLLPVSENSSRLVEERESPIMRSNRNKQETLTTMDEHQIRFHLNNPANVLEKLSAQIDAEYQAALDTPTSNLSRAEQDQLFTRTL